MLWLVSKNKEIRKAINARRIMNNDIGFENKEGKMISHG